MIKQGQIIKADIKGLDTMYYFVVGVGYFNFATGPVYTLCKTDYKLRGEQPTLMDMWNCTEGYINKLLASGEMTMINSINE